MAYTSVKIAANTNDFQSQMKSAAAQMKTLSSEYSVAAKQAEVFGKESDQLKAKAENLTKKIEVQEKVVKLNREQQENLTDKLASQKDEQENLKKKIDEAQEAYKKSTEETGKNSEQSKELKEELDKLEEKFKTNESAIGKTETALANQTVKTNKATVQLLDMENELKNVNEQLKNHSLDSFADACEKAGGKIESFGKKTSVISAGVAAIGTASLKSFTELDEGYDTIVTKTGATGDALQGLTDSANNVFGSMPEDMSTVGEAVGEVNTRFHSTGDELESLSTLFVQFAQINETDVTQSVDQCSKIMEAWNIDQSECGNLLGLLTSKAQETGISVDSLMGYVLDNNSTFKEMGLSLEQSINLMAQFDANGVDTTTALAGLKKALQNATEAGMSMDEALEQTIGSIKNAKDDTEALQIATDLFGKKGAAEMSTAIRENRIDISDLSASMSEYSTTVEDTYNGTLDPIDNSKIAMNNAKLAMSDLATTAQSVASPYIEKVTDKIKEFTTWLSNLDEDQKQTIITVAGVVAAAGPALVMVGKVVKGVSSAIDTIKKVKSAISGVSSVLGIGGGKLAIIIAVIAAVVAAGVLLYKNWDKIKAKATELFNKVKEKFDAIKNAISGAIEGAKEAVKNKVDEMTDKVKNSTIGQAAQTVFGGVRDVISNLSGAAKEVVSNNLDNMKQAYEEKGGGIKGVVAAGWQGIKDTYSLGFDFVDELSGGKLTDIKTKFNDKTDEIKTKVHDGWENMKETVSTKMTDMKEKAANKLTEIKDGFKEKADTIKDNWKEKFTNISNTAKDMMQQAKDNASQKLDDMKKAYEEKGGGIKGVAAAAFTGIRDCADSLMNEANKLTGGRLDDIKEGFSEKLGKVKDVASDMMGKVKDAFSNKMESAKETVSNAIEKIKDFFHFEWSLPKLKMPHFSIKGSFSLNPPSVPKFDIEWYKSGAIMSEEMIFGMNGNRLLAGGEPETGGEAILPLAPFYNNLSKMLDEKLAAVQQLQAVYVTAHTYIDSEEVAARTVSKVDAQMVLNTRKGR